MLEHGRKITTILAADVVEYSRLMGVDEAGTLAALSERRVLFERLAREHDGVEFGSVGDSLMAHFPSAVNAVHCAQAIQRAVERENEPLPPDQRLTLRVGVNLGDVMEKNGLLYGDGVYMAARLQALAKPGGVIVSDAVYQQVKNKLKVRFFSLGPRRLKNIGEPVLCYELTGPASVRRRWPAASRLGRPLVTYTVIVLLLLMGGGFFWYFHGKGNAPVATPMSATPSPTVAAAAHAKSIAVLPFADMSAAKNQQYMGDGMAEESLNLLAQVPELKVIARTSSFAFKGQNIQIDEIAKRLNVAHVLEGSVRTSGNQLRVTAKLVRASDSTQLWSSKYDRPLDDIFVVQDEIAKAVVTELKIKLLGAVATAKVRKPEAFALFLKARHIGQQLTPLAYEQSISLYRQAIELDPDYAAAWEGLATIYGYQALDNIQL